MKPWVLKCHINGDLGKPARQIKLSLSMAGLKQNVDIGWELGTGVGQKACEGTLEHAGLSVQSPGGCGSG